ncbi:MetQ/NlpA family ABC transporter substrate-binding protein [Geomicrobium sp. JSM 1781026]|uniref:MetQ/NlpA family ABC transporter substrate-binding protein n=1 Tax=Geomicrobium sp. JSM 1781026 TaxID=3344580 RepID=UPI0035C14199
MKKQLKFVGVTFTAAALVACGDDEQSQTEAGAFSPDDPVTVKIGVSGTDTPQWDYIAELAEEEGIEIDLIRFSDYVQPNIALAEEEIDANAFQTVSYFDNFKEEHGFDHLEAIAATVLAPLGLYSDEYERVEDIPEGAEIAIANEVTNQARNLMLLEEAGLLELEDDFGVTSGLDDIKENPLNLTLTPVQPANAPRIMADIDAAIINNGIAVDAGLSPPDDAIAIEDETATPYINIIAAREDNADDPALQKIIDIYQSEEVEQFILDEYEGASIPTFISVEELLNYPK